MRDVKGESEANRELNLLEQRLSSPSVSLILGLAVLSAVFHLIVLSMPSFRGDILPYSIAITAEFFLISQGILSFWTILSSRANPRHFEYHNAQDHIFGKEGGGKSAAAYLKGHPAEKARDMPLYLHGKRSLTWTLANKQ